MKYKLAVFDLDGTILDTIDGLAISLNEARKSIGLETQAVEQVKGMVGNGMRKLVQRSLTNDINADEDELFEAYMSYYNEHCVELTKPYSGIPQLLQKLRDSGMKTAVLTNKADFASQELISALLPGLFDEVRGHIEGVPHKPNPQSLLSIMNKLNVSPEDTVYIGDSEVDIMTGKNAGIDSISVSWGFKTKEFLVANDAQLIVDNNEQLLEELLG